MLRTIHFIDVDTHEGYCINYCIPERTPTVLLQILEIGKEENIVALFYWVKMMIWQVNTNSHMEWNGKEAINRYMSILAQFRWKWIHDEGEIRGTSFVWKVWCMVEALIEFVNQLGHIWTWWRYGVSDMCAKYTVVLPTIYLRHSCENKMWNL